MGVKEVRDEVRKSFMGAMGKHKNKVGMSVW